MNELISPEELQAQLAGPNPPTIIDVRRQQDWEEGHIPGARHIPREDVAQSLAQIPKDKPVVTY